MIPLPETCAEYQYLFDSYYGPVWRNDSRDWNGSKPLETRMLYTADQLRAYGDAVRAEERERAAQICTAAMPQPATNWCDAQIVEALRQCGEIIRNYLAQDNAELCGGTSATNARLDKDQT